MTNKAGNKELVIVKKQIQKDTRGKREDIPPAQTPNNASQKLTFRLDGMKRRIEKDREECVLKLIQ
jgi:hypothetical protein